MMLYLYSIINPFFITYPNFTTVLDMSPDPLFYHSTPAYIIQQQNLIYSNRHIPLLYLRILPVLETNPNSNPRYCHP